MPLKLKDSRNGSVLNRYYQLYYTFHCGAIYFPIAPLQTHLVQESTPTSEK